MAFYQKVCSNILIIFCLQTWVTYKAHTADFKGNYLLTFPQQSTTRTIKTPEAFVCKDCQ